MTTRFAMNFTGGHQKRPVRSRRIGGVKRATYANLTIEAIDESLEDARLNAIADERADGPFVRVSLDDL
ncbi:hypothetical protein [Paracoccus alkanivorans]|nr:hypothetical protein [Paracoccus alkanivorans]